MGLGPEHIDHEQIRGLPIVERVEQHTNRILTIECGITLRELDGQRFGVPCAKRHVDVLLVVQHQRFSSIRRGFSAPGLELYECGGQRCTVPFAVSDDAVDHRRDLSLRGRGGERELH